MDLSLFWIFFTKFYSLLNSDLQVTDIEKKRCRVFLEVITSTENHKHLKHLAIKNVLISFIMQIPIFGFQFLIKRDIFSSLSDVLENRSLLESIFSNISSDDF